MRVPKSRPFEKARIDSLHIPLNICRNVAYPFAGFVP